MSDVKCEKKGMIIPTYIPKKAHELPMFFENKPYQGASGRVYHPTATVFRMKRPMLNTKPIHSKTNM